MDVILGQNEYGKSEIRLARVARSGDRHDFRDLSVSIALAGDFTDVHLTGDNTRCCRPTRKRTPCTPLPRNTASVRSRTLPAGSPSISSTRTGRYGAQR